MKHKRAFGRYTGALTAIDMSTRFKIGTLIRSHANLDTHLEALRVEIHGTGHTLKVLRLDNEFMTQDIKTWAAKCEPPMQLQLCIPHEYHSIGDIEKFNQTLENNYTVSLICLYSIGDWPIKTTLIRRTLWEVYMAPLRVHMSFGQGKSQTSTSFQ